MTVPTERECQRTVVEAAKLCGWFVYHNRPAQARSGRWMTALSGHQGFPDLVLVHPLAKRLWFVELKRRPNVLSPDQREWARVLKAAGAEWRCVWVPEQLLDFCQLLADASRPPLFDQEMAR